MDLLPPSRPYQSLPRTPIASQPEKHPVPSTDAPPDSGLPRPTPLQVYRRGPRPIWGRASPPANVPPPPLAPASDPVPPTPADSPIAHRTRSRYPLSHYVSYHNLTPQMSLFVSSLASVSVPSSVQEALAHLVATQNAGPCSIIVGRHRHCEFRQVNGRRSQQRSSDLLGGEAPASMTDANAAIEVAAGVPTSALHLIDFSSSDIPGSVCLLKQACLDSGLFYVINHGISQDIMEEVLVQSRRFFGLPLSEKMKLLRIEKHRGYTPMFDQILDPANQINVATQNAGPCSIIVGRHRHCEFRQVNGRRSQQRSSDLLGGEAPASMTDANAAIEVAAGVPTSALHLIGLSSSDIPGSVCLLKRVFDSPDFVRYFDSISDT
ncbi:hypothetical protein NL676_033425 [Syzygium grande]|nr:hypothetical protein NL676_033425 [Syzygium grande]